MREDIEKKVLDFISDLNYGEEVTPETRLKEDLCIDSLNVLSLDVFVENEFGVRLVKEYIECCPDEYTLKVSDIIYYVKSELSPIKFGTTIFVYGDTIVIYLNDQLKNISHGR